MASRNSLIAASIALIALAGGGLYLAKAMTWSTAPTLADAPMNVASEVPPAFIMALDDSGSMVWETLNNTRDGVYAWKDSGKSFYSGSAPYGYNEGSENFYYAFPPYGRGSSAVPPIDAFGFVRSPDVNPGYFDPRLEYPAWKNADGSDYKTITPSAAILDPRPTSSDGYISGTLNLTANAESTTNNWRFRVRSGMRIPANTKVRGSCNASPKNINSTNSYTTLDSEYTVSQACDLHISYYPATFFLKNPATLPSSYGYTATPVEVANPTGGMPGTLYKYEIKPANFGNDAAKYNAAMQNFANWFSFYRTRREGLVGGALNALVDTNKMTVGWFRINDRQDVTMRSMSDATQKQALFDEIISKMRAVDSTPTRSAVEYLGKQFQRKGAGAPIQLACQKNAGMLFTDGYINNSNSPTGYNNTDGALGAPFADNYNNTMADIAAYYYNNSLRTDLTQGMVPVPAECETLSETSAEWKRLDCQVNPHMNFYGVALGAQGKQFGVTYLQDADDPSKFTPDPYTNPPTWDARADLAPEAVDEMWHATMNGRGEMINAKSPAEITAAMRRIIASVARGETLSGTIGVKGSRIGTGSMSVEPAYEVTNNGTDWFGQLTAYTLSAGSTVVDKQTVTTVTQVKKWEAGEKMPAHGDRVIRFGKLDAAAGEWVATDFTSSNVSFADLCNTSDPLQLCNGYNPSLKTLTGDSIAKAIDYLRGDQSSEPTLRKRSAVLGDIVNSSPVVSIPTDDYGFTWLDNTYAVYLKAKKEANQSVVLVGANDGMFHVFDGENGREDYAYIPATSLGHMGNLLYPYAADDKNDQKFKHRYFVDGPITVSDVKIGGVWKTIAVGTSGAGGRSVFALDITNRENPKFLWEVNNLAGAHASRIGYVLGKPVIVPVKTEAGNAVEWKVIFGNGYNSALQSATLFMVDAGSGDVQTITAEDTVSDDVPGYNGLGNISVVDRHYFNTSGAVVDGRDGYADTVYAADQTGAIWKFDLTDGGSVARGGKPLFIATDASGNRQAILGGLTVAPGLGGGVFVYFGSGSFSFNGDQTTAVAENLYGILDLDTVAIPQTTTVTRADLTGQGTGAQNTANGLTYLATTTNSTVGQSGWYLDLPNGQRFVGNPEIASGVVFFPVYEPSIGATNDCTTPGGNWLYGLNALTGGAALSNVSLNSPTGSSPGTGTGAVKLETNPKTTAPIKDIAVLTTARSQPCAAGDTSCNPLPGCHMAVQAAGAPTMYLPRACGRQSWRQVR